MLQPTPTALRFAPMRMLLQHCIATVPFFITINKNMIWGDRAGEEVTNFITF